MAGRQAERFRDVQSKIDSYLILFPVISHIGITRRLERIYNVLVSDESARGEPPHIVVPQPSELQEFTGVVQEVLPHHTQEFTLAEILAATDNFASQYLLGQSCFGKVYIGTLSDRRAAIKRFNKLNSENLEEQFRAELDILSRLRHKHIIGLLGSCVTVRKDNRLLTTQQNRKKRLLTWWRKELEGPDEPEEHEMVIVYELMCNGTLYDLLYTDYHYCMMSPVRVSWKVRIDVLLGVSRVIEHLHCHANPRIIHRDIKSTNILFDDSWVPHVSDFGLSVAFHMESELSGMETQVVIGTIGYIDPEYLHTGRLKPACDVYGLGVVMLEVLTGKRVFSQGDERMSAGLASFAVPIIEAGNFEELLDRRLMPEPMPRQLNALEQVAQTARCCLKLDGKDRPAMSDIVAILEMALELICRDKPGSVDELPNSPRASSVSTASYYSVMESDLLEEGVDTNL